MLTHIQEIKSNGRGRRFMIVGLEIFRDLYRRLTVKVGIFDEPFDALLRIRSNRPCENKNISLEILKKAFYETESRHLPLDAIVHQLHG